ncbi:MAG: response regulator [Candidatus Eisenbacteria sp.]|nr:response regulator [Candidatus Eisenbacteria bacterium]
MAVGERQKTWTWSYTFLGVIMGLLLPAVATMLELALGQRQLTLSNVMWAQSRLSVLWLMDLSPLILGLLGRAVGRQQDAAVLLNYELERRIHQVSEANRALATEMTHRAELEEQLRHSQKLEAVGQLAGGIAHDFNNLLTAIMGYSELLLDELGPRDSKREYANEIHKAGGRAASLVHQLLGFSRKQMIAPRVVDLNAALADSRRLLERVIGEDVRLDLIKSEYPVHTLIDPVQVDQVLVNLVVNARDAMPDGGTVTLRAAWVTLAEADCDFNPEAKPGEYCLLEVSDTGVGMDESTLEKIFEPFFTTKDKAKGTGLGLATTYGIVKQNGGFIDVMSHLGDGATFRIYLPLRDACEQKAVRNVRRAAKGGRECVLLVEDEEVVRALASKALRDRGYEVLEAEHAEDAEAIWTKRKNDVDLLVTDVIMPGLDGKRLAEQLRGDRSELRVLFMSGYDCALLSRHDVFEDETEFLPKPFTVDGFAKKVRRVLDAGSVIPLQVPVPVEDGVTMAQGH